MPQLSVIIPTFNRNQSLFRLLNALQKQKQIDIEIIIIDQNKAGFFTNEELIQLKQYIHIKQQKPNVSAARNIGTMQATTPYILFVDDDLVPNDDFCFKCIQVFLQNPKVKAFCPTVYGYEDKTELLKGYARNYSKILTNDIAQLKETISACLVFEKEYFLQTGGFDPILFDYAKSTEDQELFMRMQKRNMLFYHIKNIEIFHDDKTTGGCDLRSEDYWTSRQKFMKGWVYRYAMHNNNVGNISAIGYFKMIRSAFLNSGAIKQGFKHCIQQFKTLTIAIKETLQNLKNVSQISVLKINHFNQNIKYK